MKKKEKVGEKSDLAKIKKIKAKNGITDLHKRLYISVGDDFFSLMQQAA